jgi:hypothetical protein
MFQILLKVQLARPHKALETEMPPHPQQAPPQQTVAVAVATVKEVKEAKGAKEEKEEKEAAGVTSPPKHQARRAKDLVSPQTHQRMLQAGHQPPVSNRESRLHQALPCIPDVLEERSFLHFYFFSPL